MSGDAWAEAWRNADWLAVDRALAEAARRLRRARRELRYEVAAVDPPAPFDARLFGALGPRSIERSGAPATASQEPIARAASAWLAELARARSRWSDEVAIERCRQRVHPVRHRKEPMSLRDLLARMLAADSALEAADHAAEMVRLARAASDLALDSLVRESDWRQQQREDSNAFGDDTEGKLLLGLGVAAAERWLAASADAAAEWQRRGWVEGLRAGIGRDAREGWPARLTQRWIGEVIGSSGVANGLALEPVAVPAPWGAASFAEALGRTGVAILEASRPRHQPFVLHQRPAGVRCHTRHALFASIVGEKSFARRVLGLGKDAAREHQRRIAALMLCSTRVEAMRVLARAVVERGKVALFDEIAARSEVLFGEALPPALGGVLPRLSDDVAPRFAGWLCAVEEREQLVTRFDEDWFHNPRTAAALRDADQGPEPDAPTCEAVIAACVTLSRQLEEAVA